MRHLLVWLAQHPLVVPQHPIDTSPDSVTPDRLIVADRDDDRALPEAA